MSMSKSFMIYDIALCVRYIGFQIFFPLMDNTCTLIQNDKLFSYTMFWSIILKIAEFIDNNTLYS